MESSDGTLFRQGFPTNLRISTQVFLTELALNEGWRMPGCISGKQGRVVQYPKEEHHHEIQTNGAF
jgi:hypothetical protein